MQSLNLNASSALYPQQNSFNSYSQPYQLAQNSLPNSGSDVGNNGSISKAQKYVLSGNSNLFNPNQKIGNSSIFQSMSNNFQQKRKNFFNKLGYPADMSLRERGVRLIENGANLIFDTFTGKTPEYIPTTEPTNFQTSIKHDKSAIIFINLARTRHKVGVSFYKFLAYVLICSRVKTIRQKLPVKKLILIIKLSHI